MRRTRNEFYLFLIVVLVLGFIVGSNLVVAQTGSTYDDLEIFSDALSIIQSEYVKEVDSRDLIYNALKGMLDGLDPHSQFMAPDTYRELKVETEGHFGGLGIVISLDENKVLTVVSPIEDTPAFKAGVLAGDKIIKINGEGTQGLVLEEAVRKLRGPKGSKVTISILRTYEEEQKMPEEIDFTLTRDDIKIRSVYGEMLTENIGRIRLREFSEQTPAELKSELKELKKRGMHSLILDLRNNPGGLLNVAADVADVFLEKGQLIVYTESRHPEQSLRFKAKEESLVDSSMPTVVLVNSGSASASEIVAGALRDWHRAVILGSKTFGKGSVQSIIPLADGSALRLTTAKYLTPNGHSINDVGIIPDIEVKMSKEQLMELLRSMDIAGASGKKEAEDEEEVADIQLKRAIELLQGYDIFKTLEQNINLAKKQIETTPDQPDESDSETAADDVMIEFLPEAMPSKEQDAPHTEEVPSDR